MEQPTSPRRNRRHCLLNDGFFGGWAQISGEVEIVTLPDAMEPLIEYYRSISGEHPDWNDHRAAMNKQRRCLIEDYADGGRSDGVRLRSCRAAERPRRPVPPPPWTPALSGMVDASDSQRRVRSFAAWG